MNTLIAVGLLILACGVGTFLALALLVLASLGEDDDE